MLDAFTLDIAGEQLQLLPERALYWSRQQALLIADLHWGKAASFRAAGLAIPEGSTASDLERITQLVQHTGARQLILLGDVLHARTGRSEIVFTQVLDWRSRHSKLDITMVRGNHDRAAGDPPEEWRFQCVGEPIVLAPFVLCHYPQSSELGYTLAGHLHPAVQLRGPGRQITRLPCFWFGAQCGVLPSFGSFTGSSVIRPQPGDQVFVVADGEVVRIG